MFFVKYIYTKSISVGILMQEPANINDISEIYSLNLCCLPVSLIDEVCLNSNSLIHKIYENRF